MSHIEFLFCKCLFSGRDTVNRESPCTCCGNVYKCGTLLKTQFYALFCPSYVYILNLGPFGEVLYNGGTSEYSVYAVILEQAAQAMAAGVAETNEAVANAVEEAQDAPETLKEKAEEVKEEVKAEVAEAAADAQADPQEGGEA